MITTSTRLTTFTTLALPACTRCTCPAPQKPVTVHVPQNVPVNFVPVQVPTQDLGPLSVIELDPFGK